MNAHEQDHKGDWTPERIQRKNDQNKMRKQQCEKRELVDIPMSTWSAQSGVYVVRVTAAPATYITMGGLAGFLDGDRLSISETIVESKEKAY